MDETKLSTDIGIMASVYEALFDLPVFSGLEIL